ncbi:polysaccharide biosynthesis/export family protein [Algoriphagus sp. C2-6-M1]|uniref:polysaccharide biosynthesis/export family protein n=1 Tax=Algoriphagus persicinus TaxID=3108754 RepID=UPI002B3FBFB2|nr:polysaccharide biosynthesis/export family protein [Algoriphagus sp. C2-6-M1]MEB2782618.1 polysaccharide biosynthesis/export family protein [Algoriphagus sp. C2-6-M1]
MKYSIGKLIHLKMPIFIMLVFNVIIMTSCAKRNLSYFNNIDNSKDYTITDDKFTAPTIIPGDLLEITVTTINPESNLLFNYGVVRDESAGDNPVSNNSRIDGYLVDPTGQIDFPILGKVKVAGLNREETKTMLKSQLSSLVVDPKVEVRFLNFRITVIGEVSNPSSFVVSNERITVLEALGLAGDMTVYGLRDNVLLIRETAEGKKIHRFDMGNKALLSSPYYYLRQNDVIYVEADKNKLVQADVNPNTLAIISILSSIAVAFIFSFDNLFR